MSRRRSDNPSKTQATLAQLDHPDPIRASDGFCDRVTARLNGPEDAVAVVRPESWWRWSLRAAAVAAVITLNVGLAWQVWRQSRSVAQETTASLDDTSVLALEYGYQSESDLWTWSNP